MKISTFTDYSLRVLIYLAVHESQKSTSDEIATAYNISFHHVAKAAQWLRREGYVTSERGRGGGISLSRAAADINIGEIVQAAEADTILVDCMREGGGACRITGQCGLQSAFAKASSAFYAVLGDFSLADVIKKRSALSQLLYETKID